MICVYFKKIVEPKKKLWGFEGIAWATSKGLWKDLEKMWADAEVAFAEGKIENLRNMITSKTDNELVFLLEYNEKVEEKIYNNEYVAWLIGSPEISEGQAKEIEEKIKRKASLSLKLALKKILNKVKKKAKEKTFMTIRANQFALGGIYATVMLLNEAKIEEITDNKNLLELYWKDYLDVKWYENLKKNLITKIKKLIVENSG